MSEFPISEKPAFSFAAAHFFHFFFFLLSHPLYFSYFLFFFPYIFRLVSFLSPLFFTTLLLLSALISLSPVFIADRSPDPRMGFLATTYQIVFDTLRPKTVDESDRLPPLEELEAYKIVFETYTFETGENPYGDVPEVEVRVDRQEAAENFPEKTRCFPENAAPCMKEKEDGDSSARSEPEAVEKEVENSPEKLEIFPENAAPCEKETEEENTSVGTRIESNAMEKKTTDCRRFTEENPPEKLKILVENPASYKKEKQDGNTSARTRGELKAMEKETCRRFLVENSLEKLIIFPENPAPWKEKEDEDSNGVQKESRKCRGFTDGAVENPPEELKILLENLAPCKEKPDENSSARSESKAETKDCRRFTEEENPSTSSKSESSPWSSPSSFESSLGSYGSMRKEKEWRRTLACKLFEERHNSEGTEGMDSLWETYETTESKKLQKKLSKSKRGKKIEQREEEHEEQEEEEEEERDSQLCCLQALKFSAGKMNLGMGRPNLVKMSKALKGFGWLSRHGSRKSLIH